MPEIPMVHMITLVLAIVLLWSLWLNVRLWWTGRRKLSDAASRLHGARVDRGLIAEQFAPFSKKFSELGWDPQEFKFLGRPVDGIQFQDDEVIIVEFKTGAAQMTSRQRNIKKLITEGKVRFEEMRF
jgi:predicted Holliday junction resolvase-like endonuclease